MAASAWPAAGVDHSKRGDSQRQKNGGGATGRGIVEVLYLVVEHDRECAGSSGKVAAEHKNNTECTHRVEKAQHHGSNDGTASQWNEQSKDQTRRPGAQQTRRINQRGFDG